MTSFSRGISGGGLRWHWQDLDFSQILPEQIVDDELMFYLLTTSSFVERGAYLHASNLVAYFGDDKLVVDWLTSRWGREEVQHGDALRAYVKLVWAEFNWERAFVSSISEYSKLCIVSQLAPSKARETPARCMVEMATSTFYDMLGSYFTEPVLKHLARHIQHSVGQL